LLPGRSSYQVIQSKALIHRRDSIARHSGAALPIISFNRKKGRNMVTMRRWKRSRGAAGVAVAWLAGVCIVGTAAADEMNMRVSTHQ
jgi:hypothetical protein